MNLLTIYLDHRFPTFFRKNNINRFTVSSRNIRGKNKTSTLIEEKYLNEKDIEIKIKLQICEMLD